MSKVIEKTAEELKKELRGLLDKKEFEGYKRFAFKGEMVRLAIAFILGAAFNKVVTGISENLLMPIINFALSQTGSNNWRSYTFSPTTGLTFEAGKFCAIVVEFIITSVVLYILYAKFLGPEKKKVECIETISCPYCKNEINWLAEKCPHCTSQLENEWVTTTR